MNQETVARILSIEQRATQVYDDARRQSADIISGARKSASSAEEKILTAARQEAEQIVASGREAAESERARILEKAEADAQHLESIATQHFDAAVQYVLDQVIGS
ncbi:MAG: hypothetical protein JW981_09635 [Anaerolineae bacterium]|nr:hypothetical protein [Anaerolineae bacterium]